MIEALALIVLSFVMASLLAYGLPAYWRRQRRREILRRLK